MRNIYIALIFIGCLSLASAAGPEPYPTRDAAGVCTDDKPVTGCTQCIVDGGNPQVATCNITADGYFKNTETQQAEVCPRSCATCTEGTACISLADPEAFTDLAAQSCKDGYAFDNGATDNTNLQGVCISVASDSVYTCIADYFWDQTSNENRKCVAKTENCQVGYVSNSGQKATSNCDQCAETYKQIQGVTQNQNKKQYREYYCVTYTPPTPRKQASPCTGDMSVDGCSTCQAGKCTQAASGYYLNNDQAVACFSQCDECATAANVCTKCPANSALDEQTKNCLCTGTYVPNIAKTLITDPTTQFTCVSYEDGAPCAPTYTWNTAAILSDSDDYECISVYGNGECFVDSVLPIGGLKVTSFWNAPVNPNTASNRQCVLKDQGDCQAGYSVDGTETTKITDNCDECVTGISALSGVGIYGTNQYYSYSTLCQQQTPLPIRPTPVACTADAPTTGCKTCAAGKCTEAADGYYILNNQPDACLSQCGTCNNLTACTGCPANSNLDATTNNCVCNTGFVPSIEKTESLVISNQFYCVNQLLNYPCSDNYVWNAPTILAKPSESQCINKFGNSQCYINSDATVPAQYVQTSYWNAPVNPNTYQDRACVLTGSGDCQEGYSFDGTNTTKITSNCGQCATGYPTPLSGVGTYGSNQQYAFTTLCQEVTQFEERPAGVACTATGTSSEGCDTCAGGICTKISKGYFIQNSQPVACPLQCSECDNATACTVCSDNSEFDADKKNCKCSNGYAPSIDRLSATISNSYACIQQIDNTLCSDNYVWNTPSILADSQKFECISIYDQKATCYFDSNPAPITVQTSYWNALINPTTAPTRACVLSGTGACQTNYATAANSSTNISADCFSCVDKYTLLSGVSQTNGITYNMQVCSQVQELKPRALPGNCTQGKEDPVTGCLKCDKDTGLCIQPQEGYYLAQTKRRLRNLQDTEGTGGIPTACPQQCKSCNGNTACTGCYDDVKPVADNCPCPDSFTPSIDESLTKNVSNSYFCVNQFQGYPCSESNVWNSPSVLLDQKKSKCVGIFTNSSCYKEPEGSTPKIDQTCYWNSAKVKTRQCVLATGKQCANNSAQNPGDNSSSYPEPLTKNCDSCINNLVLANSEDDQVCLVPSSSSKILQLSVLILSVLMGIFLF